MGGNEDDWGPLKKAAKESRNKEYEPPPSIFEDAGKQLGDSLNRFKERMKNPQPDYEKIEEPEEVQEPVNEISDLVNEELSEDFLGKPVVTIKKIIDKRVKSDDKEYIAIIETNEGEELAAISPELDINNVQEGDIAVYDKPFLVSIVDSHTPLLKVPKFSFDVTEEVKKNPTIQVIGGLEEQIKELKEALEVFEPKKRKEMVDFGITPVRGILLYGPSGTGKTMLAKASAKYVNVPFFYANTPELFQCHLGETVQEIKRLFLTARKNAPAILYFDEITRLAAKRTYREGGAEKEVAGATEEFQAQMNGLQSNGAGDDYILVMSSTNLADIFDPAILGRFDIHIEVPIPTYEDVRKIFHTKIDRVNHDPKLSVDEITEKFKEVDSEITGRDVENLCNKAKRLAFKRGKPLSMIDFDNALKVYGMRVDVVYKELQRRKKHLE